MSLSSTVTLQQIEELQKQVQQNPSVENYRNVLLKRLAYLQAHPELQGKLPQRANSIGLEKQVEQSASLQFEEVSSSPLHFQVENSIALENTLSNFVTTEDAESQEYLHLYFQVLRKCSRRISLLTQYMMKPYDCPREYVSFIGEQLDDWVSFMSTIEDELYELKIYVGRNPENIRKLPSLDYLRNVVDNMCRSQLSARSFIGHERHRHAMRSASSVEVFLDHCESLQQWLLNALQRQEQNVVSFRACESFLSYLSRNRSNVEDGLLALSAEAEQLVLNNEGVRVSESLQKCFRLWVDLTWNTFDRIRAEVMSYHEDMGIHERCETFVLKESLIIEEFLGKSVPSIARRFMEKEKRVMLLTKAEQLLEAHEAIKLMANHLAAYKLRAAAVNRVLECLSSAVRSPVAYFLMHLPAWEEYEGRKELHQQLYELQEWIEVHSQHQTFLNLLVRVNALRSLLGDYNTSLAAASRLECKGQDSDIRE